MKYFIHYYQGTRRDPNADTGGRWLESYNVYSSEGVGKRMVVDRQKGQNQIRVADKLMVKQAGTKSRNRQGSKPGGLEKGECKKQENGNTLDDLEPHKKKWNTQLAQRDRKHRDKYTGQNKRHLEGVNSITRTVNREFYRRTSGHQSVS